MVKQLDSGKSEKRKEREEYYTRKEKLVEMERENYDKIMFMRGTGGFWIAAGHSAVILTNKVAPDLKIRVPLRKDTDYDFRFKEGVISVKNLDFYRAALKDSLYTKLESNGKDLVTFALKKKVGKEEYELLANMKELRRQQLEKETLKAVTMPKTHARLTELMRMTYKIYNRHTDKLARTVFVNKLVDELRVAQKVFILLCMEEVPLEQGVEEVRKNLVRAQASATQILELDVWSVEDVTVVMSAIIETRLALVREEEAVKKLRLKMKRAENETRKVNGGSS